MAEFFAFFFYVNKCESSTPKRKKAKKGKERKKTLH
jgi:hypothetical protein